ncbi:MAG: right-handed parallel beta-helix repeat-containing protein, partial [Myxococcota bacterium]
MRRIVRALLVGLVAAPLSGAAAVVNESGTIAADTTWTAADVHLVTGDVAVNPGIVLTIEPGTVVKFNPGRRLTINGGIQAVGTPSQPIVFTSYRDDGVGGDTNGDGVSEGQPGDWLYLLIGDSVVDSLTQLDHVELRYGGSLNGNLYISSANVSVSNLVVERSATSGIYVWQSSPQIRASVIARNALHGIYLQRGNVSALLEGNRIEGNQNGIYVQTDGSVTSPEIIGNEILSNRNWGIYYTDGASASPVITGNTITGNQRAGYLTATAVPGPGDGNVLAPNELNVLFIRGRLRATDLTLDRWYPGEARELRTYVVAGNLQMATGTTLTLSPGVIVKFTSNSELQINGTMTALGSAAERIVLTSYQDDEHGGDTNGDGYASAPRPGDWQRLYFTPSADEGTSVLDHVVLRYAGAATANLYASLTDLTVRNSEISHSASVGFYGQRSSQVLENNEVFANGGDGYFFEKTGTQTVSGGRVYANLGDGLEFWANSSADSVTGTVSGVEIFANGGAGVRSSSPAGIDARGNWWGATDGPGGDEPGSGDGAVSTGFALTTGGLDTASFLGTGTASSYLNAGPNEARGLIPAPVVLAGTDTTEWGTTPSTRLLFDIDRVELLYPTLSVGRVHSIFLTYYNPDNTTATGGTIQRLVAEGTPETVIHGSLLIARTTPELHEFRIPLEAHAGGTLDLQFVRENGYRASLAQVVIVESALLADSGPPSSAISFPLAGAELRGEVVTIVGTASDTEGSAIARVEVGIDAGTGIVWRPASTQTVSGEWTYRWALGPDGPHILYVRSRDAAGNVETAGAGVPVSVNRVAPAPVTELAVYDTPGDAGGSVSLEWVRSDDDGAGANDVVSYDVERATESGGSFAVVGGVPAGTAAAVDPTATPGTSYFYRVVAVDAAGNRTPSLESGPIAALDNTGTDTTPPEEVTGLAATAGNGFVALSWTPSVDSAGDLVEQVLDVSTDGGGSWGPETRLSRARSAHVVTGLINGTSYRFRLRVRDSAAPPNTSPGVEIGPVIPGETASTPVAGTLDPDTEWALGTFFVSASVTVPAGGVLRIDPGVIVKFAPGTYLRVDGTLEAVGTAAQPVVFTAHADDVYGGDTNGDGPSEGVPGAWDSIWLNRGTARLEHAVVRYGGSGSASLYSDRGNLELRDSVIELGFSHGVRLRDGTGVLARNVIADHGSRGVWVERRFGGGGPYEIRGNTLRGNGDGLYVDHYVVTIEQNGIRDNGNYGIFFSSIAAATSTPELRDNVITGNRVAMRVPVSALPGEGVTNDLSGNLESHVEVLGNTLLRNLTLDGSGISAYWQVSGTTVIAAGATLQLRPGVVWKMSPGTSWNAQGVFSALGTELEPIVFTSYRDDGVGGDTNG